MDYRTIATAYDVYSTNIVKYHLDNGKVKTDSQFQFKETFLWKKLDFDMISADNNYITGKEKNTGSVWAAPLTPGKISGWTSLFLPEKCGFSILDYAYGSDATYEAGTVYALSTDLNVYSSDVWSFANYWNWQKLEIDLPKGALSQNSRMDAAKTALFITSEDHFYGAWYDVSCTKFCTFLWRHIQWKADNKWCRGNYPLDPGAVIRKESVRAKRRFENRTIDEEKKAIQGFYGKTFGLPPSLNFPPTVQEASNFLSDDAKSPMDILLEGKYLGTEGFFYGKLSWNISSGELNTDWYFKPGADYPLSFTDDVLNKPGTVKIK